MYVAIIVKQGEERKENPSSVHVGERQTAEEEEEEEEEEEKEEESQATYGCMAI